MLYILKWYTLKLGETNKKKSGYQLLLPISPDPYLSNSCVCVESIDSFGIFYKGCKLQKSCSNNYCFSCLILCGSCAIKDSFKVNDNSSSCPQWSERWMTTKMDLGRHELQ